MKRNKAIAVLILLLGLTASGVVWAHGAHGHHGSRGHHHHHGHAGGRASAAIVIGVPLYGYRHGPYAVPANGYGYVYPPAYIERSDPDQEGATDGQAAGYWHYCANPQGYYPYVQSCLQGWQRVPAYPPR